MSKTYRFKREETFELARAQLGDVVTGWSVRSVNGQTVYFLTVRVKAVSA